MKENSQFKSAILCSKKFVTSYPWLSGGRGGGGKYILWKVPLLVGCGQLFIDMSIISIDFHPNSGYRVHQARRLIRTLIYSVFHDYNKKTTFQLNYFFNYNNAPLKRKKKKKETALMSHRPRLNSTFLRLIELNEPALLWVIVWPFQKVKIVHCSRSVIRSYGLAIIVTITANSSFLHNLILYASPQSARCCWCWQLWPFKMMGKCEKESLWQ